MKYVGMQSSIWSNRFKTLILLLGFPIVSFFVVYIITLFFSQNHGIESVLDQNLNLFSRLGPVIILIGIVSFFLQKQMIFGFSGAKEITRKENPRIYNIVENLCISQGIQAPKVGIIKSNSMNAFAVGRKPQKSRIVFTTGLLDALKDSEVEAVAAHEITHILNKDSLLMVLVMTYVGAILTVGNILIRTRGNGKSSGTLSLIGIAFFILGYLLFPLFRLAISRRREYLADAGSVELTKDSYAMIGALQKISRNPTINLANDGIKAMCIESPSGSRNRSWLKNMLSTHPSIEDRINTLKGY